MYIAKLIILLLLPAFAAKTPRQLVSMSVGQLSERIITSREVNANFYVETLLFAKKGRNFKGFYKIKSPEFAREVTAVLLEWVVYKESKGFSVADVTKTEIDKALTRVKAKLKTNKSIQGLELTKQELNNLVRRKLRSKKFVRFKVDSSVVPITDDEALEYFEQNRLKFGNLPFENFKQNIKSFLGRQQIDKRLKDWFDVLQNKYKVRNFLAEID